MLRVLRTLDARRWNAAGFVMLTVVTIAYLALTNENATGGYELRTLESRADALRDQVRQLDLAAIDVQAADRIAERVRMSSDTFIPVAHVAYLAPSASAVAQR
jgi:hypothetical protein